jgi:uncharacterized protein YjbI with pentapeptide repeats
LNKLFPLITFFILLLVPIGAQNAFAAHSAPGLATDGHCSVSPAPTLDFQYCDLSGVDLSGADLTGIDFSNADLSGANLSNTILIDADFVDANLSGADLTGADLTGADFSGADLSGANLDCLNHPICADLVGGHLIDIDNVSLFVAVIGTNPVIAGLIGITLASIAGPAVWFVYRRKNS